MKKNYFMLALASMMMAACANNDLVDEVVKEEVPQAIEFETFANKATRAEITNVSDLQEVGFQVWGYKAPTANPMDWDEQYTVFENVAVTYDNGWGYSTNDVPLKYWDRTSTYKFYAVAPKTPDDVTYEINEETGMITINGAASAISGDSKDYLIDRNGVENVDGNYTSTTPHATVNFDFHHIMTKVSFKLVAGVKEAIKVTRLTMTGWNNSTGKFVQNSNTTPDVANNYSEWTLDDLEAVGSVDILSASSNTDDITLNADAVTKSPVTNEYIMIPQLIKEKTLTFIIDFMIGDEVFTAQVGTLDSQQVWGTDVHVTYTIVVGPQEIAFDVKSVCNWEHNKIEIE